MDSAIDISTTDIILSFILFIIAVVCGYLAIRILCIPTEEYNLYRAGLAPRLSDAMFGNNPKAPQHSPYQQTESVAIDRNGKMVVKRSYPRSATERLFRPW